MFFEELDIKLEYFSGRQNVYSDFFNKVLSHSNFYRRFGGVFTGQKFIHCAEGLQDFIHEHDGKMQLALIPNFSEKDKEAFKNKTIDEVITSNWIDDLSQIKDKFQQDHIKALAWMIANNKLEIKLILPKHPDGTPLTISELNEQDLLKDEIGIFHNADEPEDLLSFQGFVDVNNKVLGESIKIRVSRPWIEKDRINSDHIAFGNFWNNDSYQIGSITCEIKPLSEELLDYFKKEAPATKQDIPKLQKLPTLRQYQKDAVRKWYDNDGKGIFEMATGTGKTFTAIACIKKLETIHDNLLVIISAPYTNLVDQWKQELSKWYIDSTILDKGWTKELRQEIQVSNNTDGKKLSVLICSHAKFAREEFLEILEKSKIPTMLIVDEAHHVGAGNTGEDDDGVIVTNGSRKGLSEKYQYRLGLSATIERYFDQDGTDFIRNYFTGTSGDSTVYTMSLKQAIDEEKLCRYNYYPSFVELSEEEFIEYKRLTKLAVSYLSSKHYEERLKGENLIIKRGKIVRDAAAKINAFVDIMKNISDIKHLLLFCSENQYDELEKLLDSPSSLNLEKSPTYHRITYNIPKKKKDRMRILKDFADEDYEIILSNRVLDEGMDVPQAKSCIVLASTGNPTQFIQRRGRVLRKYDDLYKDGSRKTHANIFDILVKPRIHDLDDLESQKLEIGLIRGQLNRIQQMSELAINSDDCLEKIKEFSYGLPKEVFESKHD